VNVTVFKSRECEAVKIEDIGQVVITIGKQTFYLYEQKNSLRVTSDEGIVLFPRATNMVEIQETRI